MDPIEALRFNLSASSNITCLIYMKKNKNKNGGYREEGLLLCLDLLFFAQFDLNDSVEAAREEYEFQQC